MEFQQLLEFNEVTQNGLLIQYRDRLKEWIPHPTIRMRIPRSSAAVLQVPRHLFLNNGLKIRDQNILMYCTNIKKKSCFIFGFKHYAENGNTGFRFFKVGIQNLKKI